MNDKRIYIDKPCVILVEGKLDEIVLNLILKHLSDNGNLKDKLDKVQVVKTDGKNKLNLMESVIKDTAKRITIKGILIVQDKDISYNSTEQSLKNFLDKFSDIPVKDYLIVPDKNLEGQELEDYLITSLEGYCEDKIQTLDNCIRKISNRKIGKKLFYTYLLVNDNCNYDGLSISEGMLSKCINVESLKLIQERVRVFLGSCIQDG